MSFKDIDGEILVLALDEKGIEVSTGSACTSTSLDPSHVIRALRQAQGKPLWKEEGNLRITLGRQTTKKDLDYFIEILTQVTKKMRNQ